jgi:hypothetical protein
VQLVTQTRTLVLASPAPPEAPPYQLRLLCPVYVKIKMSIQEAIQLPRSPIVPPPRHRVDTVSCVGVDWTVSVNRPDVEFLTACKQQLKTASVCKKWCGAV